MTVLTMASENDRSLVRSLGPWDAALITIGSTLGSGIFITTSDIARGLPHAGLILLVWIVGGLLTLAGALTYAELGGMFPKAGGQYHFLKEAYGRFWGFLFGWAAFFVIMTEGSPRLPSASANISAPISPSFPPAMRFSRCLWDHGAGRSTVVSLPAHSPSSF